ncbi:HK97 gp10 family phage protein [Parvibaculum sp.]|uniref:HK97 gp10 family phage protein n=1 Tax=Parvibaculum sp. TaxID=2024848 RepID=UPI001D615B19|nr:HK97 gp10 family phage protein [Parvibaculum sp.]MBX3490904.1 HK97 gp10 family phage protein [Parvibaculum sp.]
MAGFAQSVSAFSAATKARMQAAVRKIALSAFAEVILMSPVDTGRFRGNWQVAIGNVPTGTLEIDDKEGTATVSRAQAEAMQLTPGESIFLINNLPYARALEYGHSDQAPRGMVRITVQRWQTIADEVARQLREGL